MDYKQKLIEILTAPEARNYLTEEQFRIVRKIDDGINYAWGNWDEKLLRSYYAGNVKPGDIPDAFVKEWIENEDFEADGYEVRGLQEIFN